MTKQHSKDTPSLEGRGLGRVKEEASILLASIAHTNNLMAQRYQAYNAAVENIIKEYENDLALLKADHARDEKAIISLMKKNKKIIFDGTDVVNLVNGSLIRNESDHVTIPKTALEACKENKFTDVIKIVESLDRDKIEKWPDAKLTLIGAERKKKEEFKYTVKNS